MKEVSLSYSDYIPWLERASLMLSEATDKHGCIIFYQTNRKYNGTLLDKEFLISNIFYQQGFKKIFQKIILRKQPGVIDLYRPSFTSMFCFSKKITSGPSTPDVIHTGKMITPYAIGVDACKQALDFIKRQVTTDTIVDPFCGSGTVLATANHYGFHAIGVDIDSKSVSAARKLSVGAMM